MSLTVTRPLPAILLVLALTATHLPAVAGAEDSSPRPRLPAASVSQRLSLYSPRVRRSTAAYLRLRLLELREEGLDRARAAIERRLNVDDLLREPAEAGRSHAGSVKRRESTP